MTNPKPENATFLPMTTNPIRRSGLVILSLLLPLQALRAEEPALHDLLREALYTEEVTRDPEQAAKQYEDLLSRHDEQKQFAASALFRLAEVRRKQDRKEDAIQLYQRLITEFPGAETETKLAKENLAALGGKMPETGTAAADDEEKEIQRIKKELVTSPDVAKEYRNLERAVCSNQLRVIRLLLDAGVNTNRALLDASELGNLAAVKLLLELASNKFGAEKNAALEIAIRRNYAEVVRVLLASGADLNARPDDVPGYFTITYPSINPQGHMRVSIFALAVLCADLAVLDQLFSVNPDPKVACKTTGFTALHLLVERDCSEKEAVLLAKRMLDLGADPNARSKSRTFLISFNSAKVKPENEVQVTPLQLAVLRGKFELAATLVRHGANLKQPGLLDPFLSLTPADNPLPKIRFLIENGADPKQPGMLENLISSGPDALPLVSLLLEAGADPNASGTSYLQPDDDPFASNSDRTWKVPPVVRVFDWNFENKNSGNVYLHSDKRSDQAKLLELLLKHGLDPNTTYGEFVRSATSSSVPNRSGGNAGNPFLEDTTETKTFPKSLLMMVVEMEKRRKVKNVDMIGMLLDAGAKPTHEFPEVFDFVAKGDDSLPIAKALLPFHPKTLNFERTDYFLNWNPMVRRLFLDDLLNPAVRARGGVSLVLADVGGCYQLLAPGVTVPDSAHLLWENAEKLTNLCGGFPGKAYLPKLTRLRREGQDEWIRTVMDIMGSGELPDLRQGDLIELERGEEVSTSDHFAGPGVVPQESSFARLMQWNLRKRVSFPVTVEIDGKPREIQLRGDLLSFDPTKNETPLLSAGHLAMLFLPASTDSGEGSLKPNSILTVRRNGGSDTRMDLSASGAREFKLQSGDHLILPNPESVMVTEDEAIRPVRLSIPDFSYSRGYRPVINDWIGSKPTITMPTLIQVLTDAYSPRRSGTLAGGDLTLETRFPELSDRVQAGEVPVILPHPDFSRIRIKRIGGDKKEIIQNVDLSETIRRCTEEMPNADARKADVALFPGDVVELPLRSDQAGRRWQGFTAEEERFFRKALGGTVMIRKQDGIINPVEISYHQPEWKETPHGLVPLNPPQGVSTTRLFALTGMSGPGLVLKREGHVLRSNSVDPLLRDGDEISLSQNISQPRPPRQVVQPPPTPRSN